MPDWVFDPVNIKARHREWNQNQLAMLRKDLDWAKEKGFESKIKRLEAKIARIVTWRLTGEWPYGND